MKQCSYCGRENAEEAVSCSECSTAFERPSEVPPPEPKQSEHTLSNGLQNPELNSRIIFTLVALAICRLVSLFPTPGLDASLLTHYLESSGGANANGLLGMQSLFTGGGFERCAVGTLGIMPYLSATFIIRLFQVVIPELRKLAREEGGRIKLMQYGRVLTLFLCLGQGWVMAVGWEHAIDFLPQFQGQLVIMHPIWWYRIQTTVILATGTILLMWLGEQITDRGIGNGIALIIATGILARLPAAGQGLKHMFLTLGQTGEHRYNMFHFIALLLLLGAAIAGVVAATQAERKIPVQYAQRVVGGKMFSGGSSFLPLRVNYAGVMPVIFAAAILMFPHLILNFLGQRLNIKLFIEIAGSWQRGSVLYLAVYGLLIVFFTYFWVSTQFNELQIADDLKKSGGDIPGLQRSQATSQLLRRTMSRLTLAGGLFLAIIAIIPIIVGNQMRIPQSVAQFFGGTSLLIIVGVTLDAIRQKESHLLMGHSLSGADRQKDLVTLVTCGTLVVADFVVSRLRAAGIPAFIPDERVMQMVGWNFNTYGYVRVQVSPKDHEVARDLLSG